MIQIEVLEMETTMSEMKNTLDGINIWLGTAEKKLVNLKTQQHKLEN